MGKFGKKNVVSKALNDYMIGIIGPSGFGKSTLMYNVCEKLYGDEGYIILDMGAEKGVKAIEGAVYEHVSSFATLNEIVTDIVKNKATDYPNLKVVVLDTLDAYYEIVEEYVIKDWNTSNMNDPKFVKAKSINSVEGGFGKGMDRVNDVAKKISDKLSSVGVGVWWTAHIKEKETIDIYTGTTFTQLTANMPKRYFDAFKNSSHVVACGYYDRAIEKVEVGEENPVNKKKKQRGMVVEESRKIKFRDDLQVADAKSRFKYITDEIVLDTDLFIEAIQEAIEKQKSCVTAEVAEVVAEPVAEKTSTVKKKEVATSQENNESFSDKSKIVASIRALFDESTRETKLKVKSLMNGKVLEEMDESSLLNILNLLKAENKTVE